MEDNDMKCEVIGGDYKESIWFKLNVVIGSITFIGLCMAIVGSFLKNT